MENGAQLAGLRVLVVEDEYFLAEDMVSNLTQAGARTVGPAATLDQAFELCRHADIDIAILDVNLRREKVFPIADMLRKLGIPFVFASGYDPDALPPEYRNVPHWEKPYDEAQLVEALSELADAGG
jgi:CheY-like chemotaxis protein